MSKKGILIYDKTDAQHNKWFIDHIIETGKEYDLDISLKLTEDFADDYPNADSTSLNRCLEYVKNSDFAIMRNRNYEMSAFFEKNGVRCFNSSYVCKIGNDKWEMYRDFSAAGIPVMYTQTSKLPYPFVMKPKDGHGGESVFYIKNADEYKKITGELEHRTLNDFIYQMPASEKGRDIRVYVVGDMILTAMERKSAGEDIRANFSLGGTAVEHPLSEEELKVAAKVAKHINADFVGIDLIYNNGKPVVNEVEDAVGNRMLYANTDIDPVEEYIKWISREVFK